jgi:hypothetical protein
MIRYFVIFGAEAWKPRKLLTRLCAVDMVCRTGFADRCNFPPLLRRAIRRTERKQ